MSLSTSALKFFADFIEREIGIVYSDANYFQLEHRLETIATSLGFSSTSELHKQAQVSISPKMRELILDIATNNETSFFRDPHIFQSLAKVVIPETLKEYGDKGPIKIWSAAGSTGQEAYSILMAIEEEIYSGLNHFNYELLVTDFSERVLKKAKEGIYTQLEVQRGLSKNHLLKYFEQQQGEDANWKIRATLQKNITFRQLNLLHPFPSLGGLFHIVFCRNVLIYQSVDKKRDVLKRMSDIMHDGAFLVLGAAESLLGLSDSFQQIDHGGTVFYQKIKSV